MVGALAVPVAVLLLVLVFALMGRRWVLAGPDLALAEDDEAAYEDEFDPAPYRPALEPPRSTAYRPALEAPRTTPSAAYDAYRPAPGYGSVPAAREPYESRRGSYAGTPAEPYARPAQEPYAPSRPAEVSDWEPYVPSPRQSPEPSSRFPSYEAAPADPYAPSSRDPYGRSSHPSPAARRTSPNPPRADRPESPEDWQRFPYGPYDSH
jgi:hypothetical protein